MIGRIVSFDTEQLARIESWLGKLLINRGVVAVLFADSAGQPIAHLGRLSDNDGTALATLAAGSLAATVAMARLLGQAGAFQQVFFEGRENSVHSSLVGDGYLLVVAFDNRTKPGLMRIIAAEVSKELQGIVDEAATNSVDKSVRELIDREFGHSLADELDVRLPSDGE